MMNDDFDTIKSRTEDYLDIICPGNSVVIERIRETAATAQIPIIRRSTEELLKTLLVMNAPQRILEIGTAVGYSAIVMSETRPESVIDTIEIGEKDYKLALDNIALAGKTNINAIFGDASEVLKEKIAAKEKYDFIFLDAAKAQYITWLSDIKKLLYPGGVLFADNVLQDGTVTESRYAIDRRDRTTHQRMREFLYEITHDKDLTSSVIPVGDGASLSILSGEDDEKY